MSVLRARMLGLAGWAGIAACGGVLPKDDGFSRQVAVATLTPSSCKTLTRKALDRVDSCDGLWEPRCVDAQADLESLRARCETIQAEHDAELAAARHQQKLAVEANERYEEGVREGEAQAARDRVEHWLQAAITVCGRFLSREPCSTDVPPNSTEEDRAHCMTGCLTAIDLAKNVFVAWAADACVTKVVDSNGKAGPVCEFQMPPGATEPLTDRADACSKDCSERAKLALERKRALQRVAPTSTTSPSPARTGATAGRCGGNALCCDGTCSPTCACPGHRGCCSHHRGVCGC